MLFFLFLILGLLFLNAKGLIDYYTAPTMIGKIILPGPYEGNINPIQTGCYIILEGVSAFIIIPLMISKTKLLYILFSILSVAAFAKTVPYQIEMFHYFKQIDLNYLIILEIPIVFCHCLIIFNRRNLKLNLVLTKREIVAACFGLVGFLVLSFFISEMYFLI